jgi:capsular polysaccharide biosynthesis protein
MQMLVSPVKWDDTGLMTALGINPERLVRVENEQVQHLVRVPELIISTQLQPNAQSARSDPRWMTEFISRFAPRPKDVGARRVYLAREDSSGLRGGCANRHELDRIAADFGYESVIPELLTFDEQLSVATSAVDMFGEQGSALMWAMFMPPESRLVTVKSKPDDQQNRFMTFLNPVLAARKSRLRGIGVVRAGTHNYFEVNPRALRTAMEQLP